MSSSRSSTRELVVYDSRTEVARHERIAGKGQTRMDLDHYLEGLMRKPGALAGATALEQPRATGQFTAAHDAWWAAARKAHGDRDGTRALIEVLLLHRHMPHDQVVAGLKAALEVGALTADAVVMEARKIADAEPPRPPVELDEPNPVSSLTARRVAQLPPTPGLCRRWPSTTSCCAAPIHPQKEPVHDHHREHAPAPSCCSRF